MPQHPFLSFPAARQWVLLLALAVPLVPVALRADGGLRAAKLGKIGQLELAFTEECANKHLGRWKAVLREVRCGVYWDYLLIVIYSCGTALMCSLASRVTPGAWAEWGNWLAWGAWLAGLFDALENAGLLVMLHQYSANQTVFQPAPLLTGIVSSIKWALLAITLSYGLSGPIRLALR